MKKKILVIGGSHGIGKEIVHLLQEDHEVYTASRTPGEHQANNFHHSTFDVLKDDAGKLDIPDGLDGFVFCPGSINLKPFKMLKEEDFTDDMELNFFALVRVLRSVLPKMNTGGSLVFFSTVATQTGMPFHTSVAAAKGAIEGFARSLAAEYAPKLRVNVVAPSLTDTPLAERLLNNNAKKEKMAERHPLKSVGTAGDMAKITTFLLSDDSQWITGQVLKVDGGISALNIN
ncbi:SDR family oxidoreductase [Robertkochia marina]|uniref:SDR family oxidoreductase n=1 Tax=Robertkochia marina TaxID=1227945 RepID=A0A4S3LZG9_9FLAO|nr:SDR family oxidoreductase [Robertkochia marina]THD67520.1 SDR family oxidoreductase [Robertkochia marina]TRZ44613.1 SDR family oxidoreductase [Robertkochia marina]